jgi:competence protein ComEC
MVGSGATVIHATIMSALAIFGKLSNRNYNVNRSLFFAGLIMIIHNPLILLFDPSFQLSFLASLGLINLSKPVAEILKFIPEKFGFKDIVCASVSTQIAVLPVILRMTGELSVVALPANLIVLPLIPMTMLLGFIAGIVTIIFWPAGLVFGFLPNLILTFQLKIVNFFANLPFAVVNFPAPSLLRTFLFYCLIVIVFYFEPIQIYKKVLNVFSFAARLIIRHK